MYLAEGVSSFDIFFVAPFKEGLQGVILELSIMRAKCLPD